MKNKRPDLTPAQIVAGIPLLAELLHAFGVYTLSQPQQDSLSKAVIWGLGLIAGDTVLRAARNHKDGKVEAAAFQSDQVAPDLQDPPPEIAAADVPTA